MRLQRILAAPNASAQQIRAAALELPRLNLEDALAVLLALHDREPGSFSRTAARWGGRLILEKRLELPDAQLVLTALGVLPDQSARAGAEALIEVADRHGLRRVDDLLVAWLRARGLEEP